MLNRQPVKTADGHSEKVNSGEAIRTKFYEPPLRCRNPSYFSRATLASHIPTALGPSAIPGCPPTALVRSLLAVLWLAITAYVVRTLPSFRCGMRSRIHANYREIAALFPIRGKRLLCLLIRFVPLTAAPLRLPAEFTAAKFSHFCATYYCAFYNLCEIPAPEDGQMRAALKRNR